MNGKLEFSISRNQSHLQAGDTGELSEILPAK
jgi:hypothetical protein